MNATVPSICPRCAASFRCGMAPLPGSASQAVESPAANLPTGDSPCWCLDMPRVIPVPAAERDIGTRCLCRSCLQDLIYSNDLPPSQH